MAANPRSLVPKILQIKKHECRLRIHRPISRTEEVTHWCNILPSTNSLLGCRRPQARRRALQWLFHRRGLGEHFHTRKKVALVASHCAPASHRCVTPDAHTGQQCLSGSVLCGIDGYRTLNRASGYKVKRPPPKKGYASSIEGAKKYSRRPLMDIKLKDFPLVDLQSVSSVVCMWRPGCRL